MNRRAKVEHPLYLRTAALRDIYKLMHCVNAWWALVLVLFAGLEAAATSQVGSEIGKFYQVFLEKDKAGFYATLQTAALLYTVVIGVKATAFLLGKLFIISWRRKVSIAIQHAYFVSSAYCHLETCSKDTGGVDDQGDNDHIDQSPLTNSTIDAAPDGVPLLLSPSSCLAQRVDADNPDQRMTEDVQGFCSALESIFRNTAAVPINLLIYSFLCIRLFQSAMPVMAAGLFFVACSIVHQSIVANLAAAVYVREAAEGDLRAAHMRVKGQAVPIAAWQAADAEAVHVAQCLDSVLSAQRRLAVWQSLQMLVAKAGDYYSVVINYLIIATVAFSGGFASSGDGKEHGGADARNLSLASFWLIMLMNALTSTLDVSRQLGELAGHASRICDLLRAIDAVTGGLGSASFKQNRAQSTKAGGSRWLGPWHRRAGVPTGRLLLPIPTGGAEREGPDFVITAFGRTLPAEYRSQVGELMPPTAVPLQAGEHIEVSVHSVGGELLRQVVGSVFPDAPHDQPLLCIVTYQPVRQPDLGFLGLGLPQVNDNCIQQLGQFQCGLLEMKCVPQKMEREMDRLLGNFQAWESPLRATLCAHGFWADSVDPRSAKAMHGTQGTLYSEAVGAQVFLGYPVRDEGLCSLVVHPRHGHGTYPVSVLTSAPWSVLQQALAQSHVPLSSMVPKDAQQQTCGPLLDVWAAWVHAGPNGRQCAAQALTFKLHKGERLLITGPSGSGKSSLLLACQGLLPLRKGSITWRPGIRTMLVPQDTLPAPVCSIINELTYPNATGAALSDSEARELLALVGASHLLERCGLHEVREGSCWSRGEMQCLGIARVLRQRPDVVLLDEALSAVPMEAEMRMLSVMLSAGLTLLMVSHRTEVAGLASSVLTIDGALPDGWRLSTTQ